MLAPQTNQQKAVLRMMMEVTSSSSPSKVAGSMIPVPARAGQHETAAILLELHRTSSADLMRSNEEYSNKRLAESDDFGESDSEGSGKNRGKKRRGNLPKAAIQSLKAWLFQHLTHPYPSEDEKRILAMKTNLTLNQISNWFINARRRILQPMVEQARTIQDDEMMHMSRDRGGPMSMRPYEDEYIAYRKLPPNMVAAREAMLHQGAGSSQRRSPAGPGIDMMQLGHGGRGYLQGQGAHLDKQHHLAHEYYKHYEHGLHGEEGEREMGKGSREHAAPHRFGPPHHTSPARFAAATADQAAPPYGVYNGAAPRKDFENSPAKESPRRS
eukprot:Colp12_sorted_trinity150504_noHs@22764